MYDVLLFDLDGTLIDTERLAVASGLGAFAEVGHPVDLDFLHRLVGIDGPTSAHLIRAHRPDLDLTALDLVWKRAFEAALQSDLSLKPGVTELLSRAAHLPLGVVTSSRRREALQKLAMVGLEHRFAHIITVDDVTYPKPAPEAYLRAAALFGASPARCLVFEDSEAGSEAAHRAGCVVVQVPDVVPSQGKWAHHLAEDLMSGARAAGLI